MSKVISDPKGGYIDEELATCSVCGEDFEAQGVGARKLAVSHTKKTGHETWVTVMRVFSYKRKPIK